VHTPEFERERRASEVARAIERLGVAYPVALDNDYKNWRAYGNQYWPALYVVDRRGVIRYSHVGELHEGTSSWRELLAVIERLRREPVSHVSSGSRKEASTWQG
ncbi:MAG: redoxin domain-containing protein, partial [Candidatus Eisenbacteria bacterium]